MKQALLVLLCLLFCLNRVLGDCKPGLSDIEHSTNACPSLVKDIQSLHRCGCGKTRITTAIQSLTSCADWPRLGWHRWIWITENQNELTSTAISSSIGRKSETGRAHSLAAGRGMCFL